MHTFFAFFLNLFSSVFYILVCDNIHFIKKN